MVANANFTTATTGSDDWYGHGTLMAGIAGARTNTQPATGIAGVGFNTRLFNGKVLGDNGSGFESWVAQGIVWAADNGAQVISMSLGATRPLLPDVAGRRQLRLGAEHGRRGGGRQRRRRPGGRSGAGEPQATART